MLSPPSQNFTHIMQVSSDLSPQQDNILKSLFEELEVIRQNQVKKHSRQADGDQLALIEQASKGWMQRIGNHLRQRLYEIETPQRRSAFILELSNMIEYSEA